VIQKRSNGLNCCVTLCKTNRREQLKKLMMKQINYSWSSLMKLNKKRRKTILLSKKFQNSFRNRFWTNNSSIFVSVKKQEQGFSIIKLARFSIKKVVSIYSLSFFKISSCCYFRPGEIMVASAKKHFTSLRRQRADKLQQLSDYCEHASN